MLGFIYWIVSDREIDRRRERCRERGTYESANHCLDTFNKQQDKLAIILGEDTGFLCAYTISLCVCERETERRVNVNMCV